MPMKYILLHVHIFKNAGSSFDDALKHFFDDAFVDHRDDKDIIKGKMDYLENYLETHPKIQAFSSHSIYFIPKNTDKYNFFPVYFLRHPIDRIRSVYSFEKKQIPATTQGSKKAKELGFDEYISWYMQESSPSTIRNLQTIFLSGERSASPKIQEKFTIALNNLNNYPLIGVVDRYDESVVVFEEYLKEFFSNIDLSYIRKNVTDDNLESSVEEKAEKVLDQLNNSNQILVKKNNEFDMKLYTVANIQLDSKIATVVNFKMKLINFKERCIVKLANFKTKQKDYSGVIDLLNPLVRKGTNNVHIYLALANANKELKQYKKALTIYEETMKKFPNNPWAYFYQAEMYALLEKKKKAKELFVQYKLKFQNQTKILELFENKIG